MTIKRIIQPAKESTHYMSSDLRRVIGELCFAISYFRGASMRPLIWEDEHYVVVSRLDDKPNIGDVLVFEHIRNEKTAYIVHRLVGKEDVNGITIYIMRGDNCLNCERIREKDIVGKVTEVYHNGNLSFRHALSKNHFTMDDRAYLRYSSFWMKSWIFRKQFYMLRGLLSKVKQILAWRRDTK